MAEPIPDDALPLPTAVAEGAKNRSPVVNCVAYASNGRRMYDTTLDEISDVLAQPDTFMWLGLHEPDEKLLLKIQEEFALHDLAIEDAQHAHVGAGQETQAYRRKADGDDDEDRAGEADKDAKLDVFGESSTRHQRAGRSGQQKFLHLLYLPVWIEILCRP